MVKQKKCRVCQTLFSPFQSTQKACSPKCALDLVAQKKEKDRKDWVKSEKKRIKTRAQWAKETQSVFNRYIRLRDDRKSCVSCGRHHNGQYHAGHYRSVGSTPELRFCKINVFKQCQPCNTHLSGNIVEYRLELEKRIGRLALSWLEGPHEPKKYTIEELQEIKARYTRKAKALESGAEPPETLRPIYLYCGRRGRHSAIWQKP